MHVRRIEYLIIVPKRKAIHLPSDLLEDAYQP